MGTCHTIFDQVKFGDLNLKNRFVVSPLTRNRADPNTYVPNDLLVEHYSQRASFGLIITESIQISYLSTCYQYSGGIHTQEQAAGWKKVTDAVHAKGGLIILQIWHSGRAVNSNQIKGEIPIAPSGIAIESKNPFSGENYSKPREMSIQDIKDVVNQFKQGAILAKQAGFDGLELHGANGYLLDQFLRESANTRTDIYGGNYENRSRFLLEALDAIIEVFGSKRIGIRLSPTGRFGDMYDSNPIELLKYLLPQLEKRNLAFVEFKRHGKNDKNRQTDVDRKKPEEQIPDFFQTIRKLYKGNIIANDGISIEEAKQLISNGTAQAVSFGLKSLSNPDLPYRVKNNVPLNDPDFTTLFTHGPKGYIDYPIVDPKQS